MKIIAAVFILTLTGSQGVVTKTKLEFCDNPTAEERQNLVLQSECETLRKSIEMGAVLGKVIEQVEENRKQPFPAP